MPEPYFVLLQFGDTHTPYAADPADAPFAPYARDFSWEGTPRLLNQYRNAVHLQDRLIGEMLERLRHAGRLERTVVLFTSDHGEAFREHSQLFHGGSLRDEEIHVAAWVWVPDALRRELGHRYSALLGRHADFVTHLDLLPTVLDLFGVYDDPALRPHVGALPGHSLLRPLAAPEPVALTNCSDLMECAFRTFGALEGRYELEAREWDGYWNCWELGPKPRALAMGAWPCQSLLRETREIHPRLPNGQRY
jgi:arylsulfatase A-like enzyme